MRPFFLGYTKTGALAFGRNKLGPVLLYDSPRFGGECKSRKFKIVCSFSENNYNYTMIKNYYYIKSKPKNKIIFASYKNHNGKIITKDYRFLQKF